MEAVMSHLLQAIIRRRAIRIFDPVQIPAATREQILEAARLAPSSFNSQPYRFYWIESPGMRKNAARLCYGQSAAATASALVVAVADIGCWKETVAAELNWIRTADFTPEEIRKQERRAKFAKWFYIQGLFNSIGFLKWMILRFVNLWWICGMGPVSRQGLFKWATKNASLAAQNLMIAAEALDLNTCPMEGFDGRRLSQLLGLSSRYHEIIMVIAVGKKPPQHIDHPQWRRPLENTVTVL
jgi:nitroreductase